MEFRADRVTGLSSQKPIASAGSNAKLYQTVGDKKHSTVMHVVVPEGVADARAYLLEKADALTKGMESKSRPKLRGCVLQQDDDLRIVFQKKERKLEIIFGIDLNRTPAYNNRLINIMQRISQCFAMNQTILVKT